MDKDGHDDAKRKIMKTFGDIAARWPKSMTRVKNVEFVSAFGTPETLAHVMTYNKPAVEPNTNTSFEKGDMVLRFKRQQTEAAYTDDESVNEGWQLPNSNNIEGTMYHELAHILSNWSDGLVQDKLSPWLGEYYKDKGIGKMPEENDPKLVELMKKEASGYSFRYDDPSAGIYGGSKPLSVDDQEFTSDAFADVEMNGDKALELSKFIHAKMIEVFDSYAK